MAGRGPAHGRSLRAFVAFSASLALFIGVVAGSSAFRWVDLRDDGTVPGFTPTQRTDGSGSSGSEAPRTGRCSEEPCNYLLLGSDSRANLTPEEQKQFGSDEFIGGTNRADTVMLVHTDPRLEKAIILSFPRDLWVKIPGKGYDKINSAFEGGLKDGAGPQLMAQTVTDLTGLAIDHYLFVDLDGFRDIVDTLGGVEMCVPSYQVNTPGWLDATSPSGEQIEIYIDSVGRVVDLNAGLDVEPGCQRLNGTQALAYVRARHLPCDAIPDFARIGRQQQFLRSLINQMMAPAQLARAQTLISPILENLKRDEDFLPGDLIYLTGQLQGISTGNVEFRTVPGVAGWAGTQSIVEMDPSANSLFEAILEGRPISDVGTQLVSTPPSEAVTSVAVIDAGDGKAADEVFGLLSQAGFDVSPGIWGPSHAPRGIEGPAIVFRPGDDAYARVVGAYLPTVPVRESAALRGARVAVIVPAGFDPSPPAAGGGAPPASECPASG